MARKINKIATCITTSVKSATRNARKSIRTQASKTFTRENFKAAAHIVGDAAVAVTLTAGAVLTVGSAVQQTAHAAEKVADARDAWKNAAGRYRR